MDPKNYKTTTVSRGLKYNYYFRPAQQGKPTLFFCHGFPSTSRDWRYFVAYFEPKGYGLIVPDLLGYAGTDKPTDPAQYVSSKMSKDLVEIMDAEKIQKAIAIGHDWGCKAVSRLASYFPDRFQAYAFLAVPYVAPRPPGDFQDFLDMNKKNFGSELYGYWYFFAEQDADSVIRKHIDSFASILFPADPALWKTEMAPVGALKKNVLNDFMGPRPSYLSEEDLKIWKDIFMKNGFAGPTCWYKIMLNNMQGEDDKQIPPERAFPPTSAPVFYGAALQDYVCIAALGHHVMKDEPFKSHNVTIRDFDGDHWIVFSKAEEICRQLESWIEGTVKSSL